MKILRLFRKKKKPPARQSNGAAINALNLLRSAEIDADVLEFVSFGARHSQVARGQLFQDLWALWEAGEDAQGYFVEIGAHDGMKFSNTFLLEQRGWKGIVAEPNPDVADELKRNRSCYVCTDCVYSETGVEMQFLVTRAKVLSRLVAVNPGDMHEATRSANSRVTKVRSISLNDLLIKAGAPNRVDFLSVDTEGSEFQILSALDFARWDVRSIAVEHNYTPARERIHDLLSANGYRRKWPDLSRFDDWYVKR